MSLFQFFRDQFEIGYNRCNKCDQITPKNKRVRDVGYDDWGFQCIACATTSGLLKQVQEREQRQQQRLDKRKQFGL